MKRRFIILIIILIAVTGCTEVSDGDPAPWRSEESVDTIYPEFAGPTPDEYIQQMVQDTADKLHKPEMSEYERVKATFDYLIDTGYYRWSPALDLWRIRTTDDSTPDFVQTRAVSFLTHGMGTCEDYSSALVLLLKAMDMEAEYMPGLTYSRDGDLVYHAWVLAKVDGTWYHLDCELEDGISTEGIVRYKYFMKSDDTMRLSHVWGQQLIDSGRLKEDQNEEIRDYYLGMHCPSNYPTPAANNIPVTEEPDENAVMAAYIQELQEFERIYGTREYRDISILPPVFGHYGGYSSNESFQDRSKDYIYDILTRKLLIKPDR